ncbi:hypothetical protein ACR77J_07895 [Tissierella praeacuta]|uniref:hypothetical protein n=1 Tax=Tissierella praeacuta TaxID=43131 RepID=UPI003DA3AA14
MIDVIKILENQQKQRDAEAELKIFSLSQLSRLNKLIEQNNGYITNHLWDLLLFNVNDLYIKDGKVGYKTFSKTPSKKIMNLLKQYNDIIIDNFSYIMTGK